MRILALTTSYPRNAGDHAGRFVHDLHAGLMEEGHTVTTLCPAAPGVTPSEVTEAGRVLRLEYAAPGDQDLFYRDGLEANWRSVQGGPGKLRRFLRQAEWALDRMAREADLILGHWLWPSGEPARRVRRRWRRPVLGVGHGGDLHLLSRRVVGRFLSWRLRHVFSGVLCTSTEGARVVRRRLGLGNIVVAPMGADPGRFARPAEAPNSSWPEPYLLGVGRLLPIKGFDLLVRAGARLGLPVVLAGEGPEHPALQAQAAQTGCRLILAGRLPPEAVAQAMARAAAVVVPSLPLPNGRTEGCPVVAVEALVAGAPVVAAATGGLPDLLPPNALFPPRDLEGLVRRLQEVLGGTADRSLRRPGLTRRETARTLLSLLPSQ